MQDPLMWTPRIKAAVQVIKHHIGAACRLDDAGCVHVGIRKIFCIASRSRRVLDKIHRKLADDACYEVSGSPLIDRKLPMKNIFAKLADESHCGLFVIQDAEWWLQNSTFQAPPVTLGDLQLAVKQNDDQTIIVVLVRVVGSELDILKHTRTMDQILYIRSPNDVDCEQQIRSIVTFIQEDNCPARMWPGWDDPEEMLNLVEAARGASEDDIYHALWNAHEQAICSGENIVNREAFWAALLTSEAHGGPTMATDTEQVRREPRWVQSFGLWSDKRPRISAKANDKNKKRKITLGVVVQGDDDEEGEKV